MALPQTEEQARLAVDAIIEMAKDPVASRRFLDALNNTKFSRLLLAQSLRDWQAEEAKWPFRLQRMVPDALDLSIGTFYRRIRLTENMQVEMVSIDRGQVEAPE